MTTKRPELERKDDLKRRIEEASRFVPLEQLALSGQCGFSSTVEGNSLTRDEQIAKLALIVETADGGLGLTAADRQPRDSSWSRHMMLPSLSLNHAARPIPSSEAISPSHCTPGMS